MPWQEQQRSCGISFTEREEALVTLDEEIPIRFAVLEGKHLGEALFKGALVRLSDKRGEIHSDQPVAQRSNLKVQVMVSDRSDVLGELYAKVMGPLSEGHAGFSVHFTSISPELTTVFEHLIGSSSEGSTSTDEV